MPVKQGDTHPITLTVNADLTGCTVRVLCRRRGADAPVVLSATVTNAVNGTIQHTLTGTLPPGPYDLEVEVTRGTEIATFPSSGYASLDVLSALD